MVVIDIPSVPTNCRFEIDDVEEEWTWSQKFDYIHARMMTASFCDYPKFFKQAFEYVFHANNNLPNLHLPTIPAAYNQAHT